MTRLKNTFPKFGEIVIRKKLATPQEVDKAIALQQLELEESDRPTKLGELLIKNNLIDPKSVQDILHDQKMGRSDTTFLKIKTKKIKDITVLYLEGRLDQVKGKLLEKTIDKLMNEGKTKFIIDAERLVYVNIPGISSILSLIDETRSRNGDIKMYNMVYVRFIFERLELNDFIQIYETQQEAIDSFKDPDNDTAFISSISEYVSTEKDRTYHLSYCRDIKKQKLKDKLFYQEKKDAESANKKPCPTCKP